MKIDSPMYCDTGAFKSCRDDGRNTREYSVWNNMRGRCYGNNANKDASYKGCTVGPEFHSFQAFAAWAVNQIGFHEGFQLDKDLLVKGNRTYAPDRCIFLPLEVNSLLIKNLRIRGDLPIGVKFDAVQTNLPYTACIRKRAKNYRIGSYSTPEEAFLAYKVEKEAFIKEVAQQYKAVIDPRAYAALMAYQVEITD